MERSGGPEPGWIRGGRSLDESMIGLSPGGYMQVAVIF